MPGSRRRSRFFVRATRRRSRPSQWGLAESRRRSTSILAALTMSGLACLSQTKRWGSRRLILLMLNVATFIGGSAMVDRVSAGGSMSVRMSIRLSIALVVIAAGTSTGAFAQNLTTRAAGPHASPSYVKNIVRGSCPAAAASLRVSINNTIRLSDACKKVLDAQMKIAAGREGRRTGEPSNESHPCRPARNARPRLVSTS